MLFYYCDLIHVLLPSYQYCFASSSSSFSSALCPPVQQELRIQMNYCSRRPTNEAAR